MAIQYSTAGSSCHRSCAAARVDVLREVTLVCCRWTFDILVYRQQMKVDCRLFEQRVIEHLSFERFSCAQCVFYHVFITVRNEVNMYGLKNVNTSNFRDECIQALDSGLMRFILLKKKKKHERKRKQTHHVNAKCV